MKITPDTNVLVRMAVRDDPGQAVSADVVMNDAELVAIPVATLCEFVWVLQQKYRRPKEAIANSVRALLQSGKVSTNFAAVDAGLRFLLAGGDFADGAIAFEGAEFGGSQFVTFDKKASELVNATGGRATLLR